MSRLVAIPNSAANRAPALPARLSAITVSAVPNNTVRRDRGAASCPGCSANVLAAQPALSQKNRRTRSLNNTCRPAIGTSRSNREYRLCTRPDVMPHDGHAPSSARRRTRTITPPPRSVTASMTSDDRCGNSTSRSHCGDLSRPQPPSWQRHADYLTDHAVCARAHLDHDRVQEHSRVDRVQRAGRPLFHLSATLSVMREMVSVDTDAP